MAAIDDEQNDLDAAEGLADLNRIALQELPINREEEEMQRMLVKGVLTVNTVTTLFLSKGSLSSASIGKFPS